MNESFDQNAEYIVLINGLGSTPESELYGVAVVFMCAAQRQGIKISRQLVGNYCTSLDMAGFSISLLKCTQSFCNFGMPGQYASASLGMLRTLYENSNKHVIIRLESCAAHLTEQQDFLTALDRDIGDADHGLNMNRGFSAVKATLPDIERQHIGNILKKYWHETTFQRWRCQWSLYGTLFIRASAAVEPEQN